MTAALADYWIPYEESTKARKAKSQSLTVLLKARPQHAREVHAIASKHKLPVDKLRFLPYVSSKNLNWISISNQEGAILDYANIDGFI